MKKEIRIELRIGLVICAAFLVLSRFLTFPDIVLGVILGLGICLMLIGYLPEKMYRKLKNLKKSIFAPK